MRELSEPSAAMAEVALQEVEFDNRIIGYRHHKRMGAVPVTLYKYEEIIALLSEKLPQIDYVELENWVRNIMGDPELADLIQDTGDSDLADVPRCKKIAELMFRRYIQYLRVSSLTG